MVWLKECPRCDGDLFLDQDCYGKFKTCVQCGYMKDLAEASPEEAPFIAPATGTDAASFRAFITLMAAD